MAPDAICPTRARQLATATSPSSVLLFLPASTLRLVPLCRRSCLVPGNKEARAHPAHPGSQTRVSPELTTRRLLSFRLPVLRCLIMFSVSPLSRFVTLLVSWWRRAMSCPELAQRGLDAILDIGIGPSLSPSQGARGPEQTCGQSRACHARAFSVWLRRHVSETSATLCQVGLHCDARP